MGGLGVADTVPALGGQTVGAALLTPTRLYAKPVKAVLGRYRVKQVVHGIAHITGGGLVENLARIVPGTVQVVLDRGSWTVPPVFPWVQSLGGIATDEMERVFNMGIGMVLVVSPHFADSIQKQLADLGHDSYRIGSVAAAAATSERVVLR
jgi:phosphoribosylformylglycinamidine cyclo-ligase